MRRPLGLIIAFVLILLGAAPASAQPSAVFVVRHAERADQGAPSSGMMASDPDLSEEGRARAESLASLLRDAGITAIFVTEFKRTQQTAAPLARKLGLQATTVASKNTSTLLKEMEKAKGAVLVVGHSNTVPEIINGLGIDRPVAIAESEYDNLFLVVRTPEPSLIRLHFR